jgi:hypothetical protein
VLLAPSIAVYTVTVSPQCEIKKLPEAAGLHLDFYTK